MVAFASQSCTAKTVHTTDTILTEPYVATLGTTARKEGLVTLIAVDAVVTKFAVLAVNSVHALFAVVQYYTVGGVLNIPRIETEVAVFRKTGNGIFAVYR